MDAPKRLGRKTKMRAPSLGPSAINPSAIPQTVGRPSGSNIEHATQTGVFCPANSVIRERGLILLATFTPMAYLTAKQKIKPPTASTNGMTSGSGIIRQ